MSYNRAWQPVHAMNAFFREPLVVSARGGGTRTSLGEEVLQRYTRMKDSCREAAQRDWQALWTPASVTRIVRSESSVIFDKI
jgi:molybdate transport system regulatory protein